MGPAFFENLQIPPMIVQRDLLYDLSRQSLDKWIIYKYIFEFKLQGQNNNAKLSCEYELKKKHLLTSTDL